MWNVTRIVEGGSVGTEASLNKVWWSEMDVRMHETAQRLLGPRAHLLPDAPEAHDRSRWLDGYLFSLAGLTHGIEGTSVG